MSIYKRRQVISSILRERGEATIEELSEQLDVSENTIRNDLAAMEAENVLRRIRGGAVAIDSDFQPYNGFFASRRDTQAEEKKRIGRWAAQYVNNGDTVIFDASSTVYHMATHLTNRDNLTVLTNGIDVAQLLAKNPSNKVILASNIMRSNGAATVGNLNPALRKRFFAPKCFISCSGLSLEQGATESDVDEASLKTQMLEIAQFVYVLVDHSKFGKTNTYSFAALDEITFLVTDSGVDAHLLAQFQQKAHFPIAIIDTGGVQMLEPVQPREQRVFRIGFSNLTDRMAFAQQVRTSLERAASYLANVELLTLDNDLDRQTALDNADWLVQSDVDLVIEYQLDAAVGNIIMDKFNQAQIPVIAVDIPMPGATYFGADNYRAGYIAGENLGHWINKNWQGQFDLLLKLGIERVGASVSARVQGMQEGLEALVGKIPTGRIISINDQVLLHEVEASVTELLPTLPTDARIAIIAINDDAAVGALNAFEAAGRLGQVVAVGQNTDETGQAALRRFDFPFIGTTRYAPEEYGEDLLNLALKILNGEPTPPAVYKQHVFINRDNLEEYYGKS